MNIKKVLGTGALGIGCLLTFPSTLTALAVGVGAGAVWSLFEDDDDNNRENFKEKCKTEVNDAANEDIEDARDYQLYKTLNFIAHIVNNKKGSKNLKNILVTLTSEKYWGGDGHIKLVLEDDKLTAVGKNSYKNYIIEIDKVKTMLNAVKIHARGTRKSENDNREVINELEEIKKLSDDELLKMIKNLI